jgi:hypothetical protein
MYKDLMPKSLFKHDPEAKNEVQYLKWLNHTAMKRSINS